MVFTPDNALRKAANNTRGATGGQ